jgi:two-component system, NarL family, invasion response regulator UvrY
MIKVLLADGHKMIREGLRKILAQESDIVIKGEATKYKDLLKEITDNSYDVVILGLPFPEKNGIEIIREIKQLKPQIQILALSIYSEDQNALLALKVGASAYLTVDADSSELITAIRKVLEHEKYIDQRVVPQLVSALDERVLNHPHLSTREQQVLCMIAEGKTIADIAAELSLSASTISTFRARVLKKLKLKNNSAITYYAIKEGLVS